MSSKNERPEIILLVTPKRHCVIAGRECTLWGAAVENSLSILLSSYAFDNNPIYLCTKSMGARFLADDGNEHARCVATHLRLPTCRHLARA